ncbi:hypothetical protein SASPL_134712 [Salvia splendens]|uniref:Uncharacterized protein n=1 Tax=Salvia splendens TaxID=180675 RepID=A0A8X8WWU9_SALSN|nr:hypothetical protein SASPL_134712 [Salvia splendens]
MRAGILSEPETDQGTNTGGDNEPMILINPFNQTIIVQGSGNESISRAPVDSLGDYFIGPGLDLLLQHLSENDPNRYGSPPARKEAVEALRTVKIEDTLQCSVCINFLVKTLRGQETTAAMDRQTMVIGTKEGDSSRFLFCGPSAACFHPPILQMPTQALHTTGMRIDLISAVPCRRLWLLLELALET